MVTQDKFKREILPIPDKPYMGLSTFTARDPDTSFPKYEPWENWLPINQGDDGIDIIMRLYAPDLERYQNWTAPRAERFDAQI